MRVHSQAAADQRTQQGGGGSSSLREIIPLVFSHVREMDLTAHERVHLIEQWSGIDRTNC